MLCCQYFESIDLDATGVLNYEEFSLFVNQLNLQPPVSASSMRTLFNAFDENNTGFISFFE